MSYVLVVDDNTYVAQAVASMVGLFDWEARIVTSPRAALQALQKAPPALILLDFNMPGVNGIEVLTFIKRDPLYRDTPVAFVTAEDDPAIREKILKAGAIDVIIKPVQIDRLEGLLKRIKKDDSPPAGAAQPRPGP